jgi:hypothetical protein
MARPLVRVASLAAAALVLLGAGAAQAFNPQPEPPGFGMFGITEFQRAHLHVALPVTITNGNGGKASTAPCTIDVSFVNEAGEAVFTETHTIAPGTTGRAVFDPRLQRDGNNDPLPALAAVAAPVRHQLRALITPADGRKNQEACEPLVATVQVDNGDGVPTLTVSPVLSPRDAASGLPTGKRTHKPIVIMTGALAIGFGHTARLNVVNLATADGIHCTLGWTFVDETGVRNGGVARISGGQATHADFAHTDAGRGPAAIRAEVTVTEPDSGSCPSDSTVVTLEGFDSTLGHSHSLVPAQLVVPAIR